MNNGKQKIIFLMPLPFVALAHIFLFETEAEKEECTHLFGHTQTHTYLHHQKHSPFYQFTSEKSIKSESRPICLPLLPIFFLHNPQCIESKSFPLSVLCGHMSVSSSHRLRLCSLLQEMPALVSKESKWDKGFKECR